MNFMERLVLNLFGEYVNPEAIGIMAVLLILYFLGLIFVIISYMLSSSGLYTIAKRRGIRCPWLAWIPVASTWMMGSISDHYQYVAKGKVTHRRKVLLGLNIVIAVLPIVLFACDVIITIVDMNTPDVMMELPLWSVVIMWFAMMISIVILCVFTYLALYDLYNSCNPDNAVVFLLLSIFISATQPFFVFSCRKKELGMPPRRQLHESGWGIPQSISSKETVNSKSLVAESTVINAEPNEYSETE